MLACGRVVSSERWASSLGWAPSRVATRGARLAAPPAVQCKHPNPASKRRKAQRARVALKGPPEATVEVLPVWSRTSSTRLVDLQRIFDWEELDDTSGATSQLVTAKVNGESVFLELPTLDGSADPQAEAGASQKVTILLDGANMAWAYGVAVCSRFKDKNTCRIPLSQGVTMALDHPQWAGFDVKAVMPYSYVQGDLRGVADGVSTRFLNADKVVRLKNGQWRNLPLWAEYQAGRLMLVRRPPTQQGRKLDDQIIIKTAAEIGAYVCSNDGYRDHTKDKSLGFLNRKRVKAWTAERKFNFRFHVATGLSDELLAAMVTASGFQPCFGIQQYRQRQYERRTAKQSAEASESAQGSELGDEEDAGEEVDAEAEDVQEGEWEARSQPPRHEQLAPYHCMPPEVMPVVFEPVPSSQMMKFLLAKRAQHQRHTGQSTATTEC